MSEGYAPVKGKCTWWRERPLEDDMYQTRIKEDERRWACSCFVEGDYWTFPLKEVPSDCPRNRYCRYYIQHL